MTDSLFDDTGEPSPAARPVDRAAQRAAAEAGRDAGMAAADGHADELWKAAARDALDTLVRRGRPFIGDDVWDLLDERRVPPPSNLRALGPIMQAAARSGLIHRTGDFRPSVRSHMSPKPVWTGNETSAP